MNQDGSRGLSVSWVMESEEHKILNKKSLRDNGRGEWSSGVGNPYINCLGGIQTPLLLPKGWHLASK